MISFAGVPLRMGVGGGVAALDLYWHGQRIAEFDYSGYLVGTVSHLSVPFFPKRESPRFGVLSWPVGADRFATCHLMATGDEVASIRTVVGAAPAAQTLVLDDGNVTVSPSMYLLAVRPISQRGDGREMYMLTLVDERFYWWQAGNTEVSVTSSWAGMLSDLFASIGVTPTVSSIPAAYLTPYAARWNLGPQPVPVLIEAACRQIGMRVVRRIDGTVHVENYTTAAAADAARWTALSDQVWAGGRLTGADVGRSIPATVDVGFFDGTSVSVALTALAIAAYGGVSGVATAAARVTADPEAPSAGQKVALSLQMAGDYYSWALALTDCTLRGFQAAQPNGLDDLVEWVHSADVAVTRVLRPEWSDHNLYGTGGPNVIPPGWIPGGTGSGAGSGPGCSAAIPAVTLECNYGVLAATIKNLAVGVTDNQLVLSDCGTESRVLLGPCSTDEIGAVLPVATKICPVFTTLNYLDHDSQPQTIDVVTSIRVQRRLIGVPMAAATGCADDQDDCCSGSGEDTGSGCLTTCPQCDSMSSTWSVEIDGYPSIQVSRAPDTDAGNVCRFVSDDLNWNLYYDGEIWLLVNYDTEEIWYLDGELVCTATNVFTSESAGPSASVAPLQACGAPTPIESNICGLCELSEGSPATLTAAQTFSVGGPATFDFEWTGSLWEYNLADSGGAWPCTSGNPGGLAGVFQIWCNATPDFSTDNGIAQVGDLILQLDATNTPCDPVEDVFGVTQVLKASSRTDFTVTFEVPASGHWPFGGELTVDIGCCCPTLLPEVLQVNVTDPFNCDCVIGATIPITWNGTVWTGTGTWGSCGAVVTATLTPCWTLDFVVGVFGEACYQAYTGLTPLSPGDVVCAPFSVNFAAGHSMDGQCGCDGGADFGLTVTLPS